MRALIVFRKTMREILRDKWMLGLTLAFAPFFVFLYWLWFQGGSSVYPIAVINHDQGTALPDGSVYNAGDDVSNAIRAVTYSDGRPLLKVVSVSDQTTAETILREFSWRAVLVGAVLGMVFGASSLYLVLKVGLTVRTYYTGSDKIAKAVIIAKPGSK